jgi:hypothetical protein
MSHLVSSITYFEDDGLILLVDQNECETRALHVVSKDNTPEEEDKTPDAESPCKDERNAKKKHRKPRRKAVRSQGEWKEPKTDDFAKVKKLLIKMGVYNSGESESERSEYPDLQLEKRHIVVYFVVYTYVQVHYSTPASSTSAPTITFAPSSSFNLATSTMSPNLAASFGSPNPAASSSSPNPARSNAVNVGGVTLESSPVASAGPAIPCHPPSTKPQVQLDGCTASHTLGSRDFDHTQTHSTSDAHPAGNDDSGTTLMTEDILDIPGVLLQEDPTPGEYFITLTMSS